MDNDQMALLARPYGLGLIPDPGYAEYTDPHNEALTQARWRPLLEELGITLLGIRDVPTHPTRLMVDGIEWDLMPMRTNRTFHVPPEVYHRIEAARERGIPFAYWIWGEEQFPAPAFQPFAAGEESRPASRNLRRAAARARRERDPIVIGVIPTAPHRGMFCLLGKWFH